MPEKKALRLTCPVCETHLKVAENIEQFACLNCGAELKVVSEDGLVNLIPTQAATARMTGTQQQLIEVNSALKNADDIYGVGCAITTMGITLVACIILAVAIVAQSMILFWSAIAVALTMLAFVLFMFLTASSRGTDPLLRRRDRLQAEVAAEESPPEAATEIETLTPVDPLKPGEPGETAP
jgi:hypothetical protein